MINLESLIELQETCNKSLIELQNGTKKLDSILNEITFNSTDTELVNSINDVRAQQERLMNFAKQGKIKEVLELTKELNQKYANRNK